jgi:hypothetical protein
LKTQVTTAYHERMSLRGFKRTSGISRHTVSRWLKKDKQMRQEKPLHLETTLLPAQSDDVLELNEFWPYLSLKKSEVWL